LTAHVYGAPGLRHSGADIAGAGALAADGSSSSSVAEGGLSADMFAQLLLDMHRHVGVVLLDRMAHGQTRCLTQHLQAAAKVGVESREGLQCAEMLLTCC
jgi:hypothetical protein